MFRIKGRFLPSMVDTLLLEGRRTSFYVKEKVLSGDTVGVLVRGERRSGFFGRIVDEEWVVVDVAVLADQFCVEKYGKVCDRRSFEWRREYIRAKLVATRYAIGLAKKRIELRFAGRDFRDFTEKDAEKFELTNIYLTADELRKEIRERKRNTEHLAKIRREHPEIYEELLSKYRSLEGIRFRTEEQSRKLHALVSDIGISEEDYRKMLKERFGVSSSMGLTVEEAGELIEELERKRKEMRR